MPGCVPKKLQRCSVMSYLLCPRQRLRSQVAVGLAILAASRRGLTILLYPKREACWDSRISAGAATRSETPLLHSRVRITSGHVRRGRPRGNVRHHGDDRHHGNADRRRRKTQSSARTHSSRDRAQSTAAHNSHIGADLCGSANGRDGANNDYRGGSGPVLRPRCGEAPDQPSHWPAPLKLD